MRGDLQNSPSLAEITARRWSRRGVLAGGAGVLTLAAAGCATSRAAPSTVPSAAPAPAPLTFQSVAATNADTVSVPAGYRADVLIGWGDPLFEGMARTDDINQVDRAEQERRFGANNDMLALFPATFGAGPSSTWLLCANHEYADPFLMYPDLKAHGFRGITGERWAATYAAVGVSVVELEQQPQAWRVARPFGPRNRRITNFTPVQFTGPAARHPWITAAGAIVNAHEPGENNGAIRCGTTANCAGGLTPWGTFLSVEENFNYSLYVSDTGAESLRAARRDAALILDAASYSWPLDEGFDRPGAPGQFDTARNPTIAALYGWTVEIDPYDAASIPKKRTALGRRKGENASVALARDSRVVVYSGDDQVNEFVYKFISHGCYDSSADRTANMDLLEAGDLYVARFEENGTGRWLKLNLAAANRAAAASGALYRFADEADLLVRARLAARLLGATPMDRPEDVEILMRPDWVGLGPVLIVCTKNPEHGFASPGNPRRPGDARERAQANLAGHILRLDEANGDLAATHFTWDIFVMAGDPNASEPVTHNLAFDGAGNLYISSDGSDDVFGDCNNRAGAPLHNSVAFEGRATATGDRFACPDSRRIRPDG